MFIFIFLNRINDKSFTSDLQVTSLDLFRFSLELETFYEQAW